MNPPDELLDALCLPDRNSLLELGVKVGKLYTDHGLPIDMALERLKMTKQQKLLVLFGAQTWTIEHRRSSNATDKALARQRKSNSETLRRFLATGEAGVY